MENGFKSWESFYNRINLVFNGIIAMSLIPFGWLLLEMEARDNKTPLVDEEIALILTVALSLVSGISLLLGHLNQKKARTKLDPIWSLGTKLNFYFNTQLRRYVHYEGAAILALVGLYLTRSYVLLAIYVLALFFFSIIRPTFDHVCRYLQLSKEEQEELAKEKELKN